MGVALRGFGAHGAAGAGVLLSLLSRGVEPFAVTGQHAGAWPAALYAAGATPGRIEAALCQAAGLGERLIAPKSARGVVRGGAALADARRLERLLAAQGLERPLDACPRAAAFPCRTARGARVTFSTRPLPREAGETQTRQATAGFAARAAMALPPFLPPLEYMGAPLLPDGDAARACRALFAMGAERVLVVEPVPPQRGKWDALELAAACSGEERPLPEGAARLRIAMPERANALALGQIERCAEAGREAAEREIDAMLERLGVRTGRVLLFRRKG